MSWGPEGAPAPQRLSRSQFSVDHQSGFRKKLQARPRGPGCCPAAHIQAINAQVRSALRSAWAPSSGQQWAGGERGGLTFTGAPAPAPSPSLDWQNPKSSSLRLTGAHLPPSSPESAHPGRSSDFLHCAFLPGFPGGSAGKESTCNVGDLGLIPGLGRSPGEGKGYPFQYSGLDKSMDCIVPGVPSPLCLGRMAGGALSAYTVVGFSWKAVWVYLWGWNRGRNRGNWEGRKPHTRCCTSFHPPGLTEGLHKSMLGRGVGGCEAEGELLYLTVTSYH